VIISLPSEPFSIVLQGAVDGRRIPFTTGRGSSIKESRRQAAGTALTRPDELLEIIRWSQRQPLGTASLPLPTTSAASSRTVPVITPPSISNAKGSVRLLKEMARGRAKPG
jgi:hypothetical protein